MSGGSEAAEAAIKLARQYHLERGEPKRYRVIARRQSYHGNTLGALAAGGNEWRRAQYAPLLTAAMSHIAPCHHYRWAEPGESLEDAVAREVYEEVGLDVTDIEYRSSQPWPFPSSIMLGFVARATGTDLNPALDEIESAQWVNRDQVVNSPEDESFHLPSLDSIARRLILDWLEETA